MKNLNKHENGTALITLLFFTLISVTICSAAVVIIMTNSLSGAKMQQGLTAYEIAKSGAENAKLQLLRNPDYRNEVITIGDGKATIQVNLAGGTYTIISTGETGNFKRKAQVIATYQNYVLTFSPVKEIY
jgi:type II secretory pathway component PulK